jgi:prophage antirepressor-like protein
MTYQITTLHYHRHALEAVELHGQKWLRGAQLVGPLGLRSTSGIDMIFARNSSEFGVDETQLVTLPTAGGEQEVRLFSLRGARLLALLARTPEAKAFRRWVLDLLEGRARTGARLPIAEMPAETQIMLRDLQSLPPAELPHAIAAYLQGSRGLPQIGPLTALRAEREAIVAEIAERHRALRELYLRARRLGYSPETLKWRPPAQSALAFDTEPEGDANA